jgi:epoxyqueuosine reductase
MDTALADDVRRIGLEAGLDAVGLASATPFAHTRVVLESRKAAGLHGGMHFTYGDPARSTDPARSLPGAQALVVGVRSYRKAEPTRPPAARRAPGTVARYSWRDEYEPLRQALQAVADHLGGLGYHARVLADDNALVDRAAAVRAGLGWYGKNANVLVPGLGSYVVLGSVVTDAPLADPAADPDPATAADPDPAQPADPGQPAAHAAEPVPDGCGACTRCLPACPTGAIVAPGVIDARRCLAWLLEAPGSFPQQYREALGGRIYGCDDCQEACPPNRAVDRHAPAPPAGPDDEAEVDLVELLDADDAALLARFGRWYIPRRQARYLRRNALVAIGNVADPADADVQRVVGTAQSSPDPIVKEHADWAAARLAARARARGRARP